MAQFKQTVNAATASTAQERETFRGRTLSDLAVPMAWAAGLWALLSIFLALVTPVPVKESIGWGVLPATIAFVAGGWDVVFGGLNVLEAAETATGLDLNRDGVIGGLPQEVIVQYQVQGTLKVGNSESYYVLGLMSQKDAEAWHAFCKDVAGGKNFSHRLAVREHKLDERVFDRIVEEWNHKDEQRRLFVTGTVKPQGTMKLNRSGEVMVRMFADTPPPSYDVS